jgi:hypothetical protein
MQPSRAAPVFRPENDRRQRRDRVTYVANAEPVGIGARTKFQRFAGIGAAIKFQHFSTMWPGSKIAWLIPDAAQT